MNDREGPDSVSIRKWLLAFGSIVALAVAAHGAYWWLVADGLRDGFSAWVEDRRAAGWVIGHAPAKIDGYPMRVRATIGDPDIAGPAGPVGWRWSGPRLRLTLRPWRPREILVSAPGRHRVQTKHGDRQEIVETTAQSVDGRVRLAPDGRVQSIVLDVVAAAAHRPDVPGRLQLDQLGLTLFLPDAAGDAAAQPDSGEPAGPFVSISAANVVLPEGPRYPLGRAVRTIAIDAKLLGEMAAGPTPAKILAAWRDSGGTIEFRRLEVVWGGLDLSSEGSLALDGALQPIAAMTARIRGYREIIDALVETGYVRARDALATKLVLGVVARATPGGKSRLTVPVTIQNGVLSAGPARLFRLPAIDWPAIDRAAAGGATR